MDEFCEALRRAKLQGEREKRHIDRSDHGERLKLIEIRMLHTLSPAAHRAWKSGLVERHKQLAVDVQAASRACDVAALERLGRQCDDVVRSLQLLRTKSKETGAGAG